MFSSGRTSRRRGRSDERPSEDRPLVSIAPRIGESANCNENPHVCGKEAACRSLDSETSRCVCPHDLSPPTRDLKCPNRLLAPLTPRPIYNIIVPPNGNGTNTTNATNATTVLPDLVEQVAAADRTVEGRASKSLAVAISGLALLAFLTLLVYLRRARCTSGGGGGKTAESRRSAITSPRSLKTEPPLANGYTPNLHYSNCSPPPEVPLLPRHEVQFLRDIGEGCFGKVFKGEIRGTEPTTKNWVAVKVLKDTASREAEEDFMREVEIMSTFRHENILSLMGVVPRDSEGGPWMIFEYMAYGDLAGVLRANGKRDFVPSAAAAPPPPPPLSLTKSCLEWTTLQIAAGMDYLSSQRFVHRDLACRNCLVGANLVVKIADFGMSRDVYTCDYYKIGGSRLLPVRWMSPESLVYGRFTLESDVWSFGVVLWEIYSWGKQPYYGRNNEQVVKLIVEGSTLAPPDDCPLFVEKLMHDCWRSEPRDRLRFVEILERLELLYRRSEKPPSKSLPRPPQAPVTVRSRDVLDTEGYLLPAPTLPIEYLQTLADSQNNPKINLIKCPPRCTK